MSTKKSKEEAIKHLNKLIFNANKFTQLLKSQYFSIEHVAASLLAERSVEKFFLENFQVDASDVQSDLIEQLSGGKLCPNQWSESERAKYDPDANPTIDKSQIRQVNGELQIEMGMFTASLADLIETLVEDVNFNDYSDPEVILGYILMKADTYIRFVMDGRGVHPDKYLQRVFADRPAVSFGDIDPQGAETVEFDENGKPIKKAKKLHFCTNLNDMAKRGKIDPIIGRDDEIQQIMEVMCRRRKNNVILVGVPGVGKTAIAEGLAYRIQAGDAPKFLKNKEVWKASLSDMLAGASHKGEIEERMKYVAVQMIAKKNAILFLDEIHLLTQGKGQGHGDAAEILKPLLTTGELQVIGATTDEEYRSGFQKDKGLVRRFTKVTVEEPSQEDAVKIVEGLKSTYEEFHGLSYDQDAIEASVELSGRHVHGRAWPDKAVDVLDAAGAAVKYRDEEGPITVKDIMSQVAKLASIDESAVNSDEAERFRTLDQSIKSKVFGQDKAVDKLCDAIMVSKAGMREPNKPVGSFLFAGPTGTGKTECATQLAKSLGVKFIRYNMSEFSERHTVSRLIGSPPGYVGYNEGNSSLINDIEKNPDCVLLLDEVEKACEEVRQLCLQIMDEGKLKSSDNKEVSFTKTIVIMTSNLGAAEGAKGRIGFENDKSSADSATIDAIKDFFKPEFINRFDGIVRFKSLGKPEIAKIVDKVMADLNALITDKNVVIKLDKSARDWLTENGYSEAMGARPLKRLVNKLIQVPISREIIHGKLKKETVKGKVIKGGKVTVSVGKDNEFSFKYKR